MFVIQDNYVKRVTSLMTVNLCIKENKDICDVTTCYDVEISLE